jgi:hypothetical protein
LIDVYPGGLTDPAFPKQFDGTPAMIDIHLYTQAEQDSEQPAEWLADMLQWWTIGATLYDNETYQASPFANAKYIVGEFGWKVDSGHCYVQPAISGLLGDGSPKQLVSALYFCYCDKGLPPSQFYGILNDGGSVKTGAIDDYNWCVEQYQGPIGTPVPTPTPPPQEVIVPVVVPYKASGTPKPNDLIMVITGQDGNIPVGDPYGNTEQSAAAWMVQQKLAPLSEKAGFNFAWIQTPLEIKDKTPYATGIPATLKVCFAYAKARPTRHFDIVSWHTDSTLAGDDPTNGHYGLMARDAKGQALGKIWAKYFGALYGSPVRYLLSQVYPEYYALGQDAGEIPANVTLLLAETGVHGAAAPWKWYLDNVDKIASAAIAAETEALAVAPTPPLSTDYQKLYEEALITIEGLQADNDEFKGIITNALADNIAIAARVKQQGGELSKAI